MENVSSTLSTPAHAFTPADARVRARTTALNGPNPMVVITSVLTQTVHPTLVLTESTIVTPDQVTRQTTAAYSSPSIVETAQPETQQTTFYETAGSETVLPQTNHNTLLTTPTSSTSSSSSMEDHDSSHTSSSLTISTSPSSSVLSIITSSSSTEEIAVSITQSASTPITSTPLPASHSPTSSPITSPLTNVMLGSTSSPISSGQAEHDSTNVGAIVGGTVGGAAFIALGVLACCFFIHRKGHTALQRRQISKHSLLGSHPSSPVRSLEISEPTLPTVQPPVIPSAPVFPARKYSNSVIRRPDSAVPIRDVPVMGPLVHAENDHGLENPFADPKGSPDSLSVGISAPPSAWSLLESASEQRSYQIASNPGESNVMPLNETNKANKANTTQTGTSNTVDSSSFVRIRDYYRTRVRSDPWDLEPSLDFLQKGPAS